MTPSSVTPRRVVIIQARSSSSRFPGKVLEPLLNLPLIVFMATRVRQSKLADHVMVATSTDPSDDTLHRTLIEHGIACHRGNLNDVLDRYYQAACAAEADHIVRLTGDCPLMDADLIDRALGLLASDDLDYVSNIAPPSYADGLDVEAFTIAALREAWQNARLPSEREHVTLYLRAGHAHLRTANWSGLTDLSSLRWTIDHPDDLAHVKGLLKEIGIDAPTGFDRFDIYRGIERRNLGAGAQHQRNEGLAKSLAAESTSHHIG
ncbi:spore coat polysaccharide biosynthesis protein SpsF (cytidylyltransferase family) [Paucibacter oligotrophus]|uniref:Spore coat polysaccharide biosynthesis protein SpsF (Cytidylyltransferase family) n=1 Tax=Roseateles oligotrophus TaxID=1769250 RepID=A0A840LAK8_9BURK|nr:glycosyltransferase family protein [Roseateles oligotrophus]MBB4842407.1 spore coat polysaccharide biosynthesis protein SpsF (cytidylyltransferase family) [Roseateles oligotrophus]